MKKIYKIAGFLTSLMITASILQFLTPMKPSEAAISFYNVFLKGDATVTGVGTSAGVIKSVQAGTLTVKTTLPTTAGAAGGAIAVTGAAGAVGTTTTAGGAGGANTLTAGNGGAKTGTGAAAGGAGGIASTVAGTGGATASAGTDAGGAGGNNLVTAGTGGAASAGTGNGGKGGSVILQGGTGGTSAGGTAGIDGLIALRGIVTAKKISAPTAETAAGTLTAAELMGGLITLSQATGATVAMTTCTGTELQAALPTDFAVGDSFDFTIINIGTADAANTGTLTAGASGITIVGPVIIPSAHSTTIADSARTYRARKTAANTFIIYAV